jgi:anti-anti-sigma factor
MEITLEPSRGVIVLGVRGRLTEATAEAFQARVFAVIDDHAGPVLVDCAGLDYVSSSGLRAIYLAARKLAPTHRRLNLCAVQADVRMIFEMVKLSDDFPMYATREEALESLSAEG